jgi:DNA replication protein DnaC
MNREQTLSQLRELNLQGMYEGYESIIHLPMDKQPEAHYMLADLVEKEKYSRQHKKMEMYLKLSKIRYTAQIQDIECSKERNLSKEIISHLADCNFIKRGENILMSGSTGCGKSYLACAIAHQACSLGHKTLYLNMNKFVEQIAISKIDGTYVKQLSRLERHALVILDDFGLQPLKSDTRLALLQILEDRYKKKSTIIASQLPIEKWYEYIGDPTLADAIMDRLIYNAHKIELKGPSMRERGAKSQAVG